MEKDLEKLSALYDGELDEKDSRETLNKIGFDEDLKKIFHKFGIISEIAQKNSRQIKSKVSFLSYTIFV